MNKDDLKVGAIFTTNGHDVWRLQTYCLEPTCTLKNLDTGKIESFGLGGFTSQSFRVVKELGNLEELK